MIQAGAAESLIELLSSCAEDGVAEHACGALAQLSNNLHVRQQIIDFGTVGPLVQLLSSQQPSVRLDAIITMANISSHKESWNSIRAHGAVPHLIHLASLEFPILSEREYHEAPQTDWQAIVNIAIILRNLSSDIHNIVEILRAKSPPSVSVLIAILNIVAQDPKDTIKAKTEELLTECLEKMSVNGEARAAMIADTAFPQVISFNHSYGAYFCEIEILE